MRFVPDEQSFTGREIRDASTSVPSDYEAPVFQTKSLQHTNIELTWDKGDEGRKRALTRKLNADELKEDDFRAYLASSSGDEGEGDDGDDGSDDDDNIEKTGKEGNAEAIRERYRRLLLGGGGGGGGDEKTKERKGKKDWGDEDNNKDEEESDDDDDDVNDDKNMEMEVTFASGLEGLGDRLLAKRKEAEDKAGGETVWDAYMRRKKEKKAEARRLGKVNIDSDDDSHGDGGRSEEESGDGDDDDDDEDSDALPAGVANDPFFQHDDDDDDGEDPFNDPFFNDAPGPAPTAAKKSRKKSKRKGGDDADEEKDEEAVRRQKAELEMLLLDESTLLRKKLSTNGDGGAVVKKMSKKERMRLNKQKKRQERDKGSDDEDHEEASGAGFKVNLDDPRFKSLLTAPEFALDPTDPRFAKAGPGAVQIAAEVTKRRGKKSASAAALQSRGVEEGGKEPGAGAGAGSGSKADLKFMVASLKRKAMEESKVGNGGGKIAAATKSKKVARR